MVRKLDALHTRMRARIPSDSSYFFARTDQQRLKEAELRKKNWKFTGRISPSALEHSMCPRKHVYDDLQTFEVAAADNLEKMAKGRAFHRMYLEDAAKCDGLLYENVKVPDLILKKNTRKDWIAENVSRHPSIMLVDEFDIFSGECDCVMNLKGKPAIADLKFPQEYDIKRWKEKSDNFPEEKYLTQLCVYAELCNKYGYTDVPVETIGIIYRNPIIPHDLCTTDFELYIPYDDELKSKTQALMVALYEVMRECLILIQSGTVSADELPGVLKERSKEPCDYAGCKKHNK